MRLTTMVRMAQPEPIAMCKQTLLAQLRFIFTFCLAILLSFGRLYAEDVDSLKLMVYVKVYDNVTSLTLKGVKASILDTDGNVLCDSMPYVVTPANSTRLFEEVEYMMQVPKKDRYRIIASRKNYFTYDSIVSPQIPEGKFWGNLPGILLVREPTQLDEVAVTSTKIKMVMRGDTVVYDATAFLLPDGSMLDDLIAALPYAKIDAYGRISVNNKPVESLLVNGRDFFKGDPMVALKNLPFYTVKNIKVYHRTPERFMYSKKERTEEERGGDPLVMDVTLKPQYIGGWLANVELGAGCGTTGEATPKWLGRVFAMHYNKRTNIVAYGQANNLNDDQQPDRKGYWELPNLSAGEQTLQKGGLMLNTVWADQEQNGVDLMVNVTHSDGNYNSKYMQEEFMAGGRTFSNGERISCTGKVTVNANGSMTRRFRVGRLKFDAQYEYRRNVTDGQDMSLKENADDDSAAPVMLYRHHNISHNLNRINDVGGTVGFEPDIAGANWLSDLSVHTQFKYRKEGREHDRTENLIYPDNWDQNFDNRYTNNDSQYKYSIKADANASTTTFNAGRTSWLFKVQCDFTHSMDKSTDSGYISEAEPIAESDRFGAYGPWLLDVENSTSSRYREEIYTVAPSVRFRYRTLSINVNPVIDLFDRKYQLLYAGVNHDVTRTYLNINPNFSIGAGKIRKSIEVSFSATRGMPRLYDMLDFTRRPTPLYESEGNPDLRRSTTYTWSAQGQLKNVSLNARYAKIDNSIATGSRYNSTSGATTIFSENVNGAWHVSGYVGYDGSFMNHSLGISNRLQSQLSHNVNFSSYGSTSPTLVSYDDLEVSDEFSARYSWRQMAITATAKAKWYRMDKARSFYGSSNYWDINYGLSVTSPRVWGISFETSLRAYCRRGYGTALMNNTDWVWNLSASRALDRKRRFVLKIIANDILQQFPNVSYRSSGMSRSESSFNTQPAYVIATLTYRLDLIPKNPLNR